MCKGDGPLVTEAPAAAPADAIAPAKADGLPKVCYPEVKITAIDDKDKGTPDEWVPRHPSLVRLTGRHPFNCEPPLTEGYEAGWITPASLHFVRNHGYAHKGNWEEHTVTIKGAVTNPLTLTMRDIVALPSVEIPVTLVCAGNRRKEENMVKQTIGFSWGAHGVSNSVWKGVRLCELLKLAGIKSQQEGAKHVCFLGSETLPKGKYGTSMKASYATNPANDVLVAYEQNGKPLLPDHGFPVRMIIPGWIGGRMVKWLEEIEVTDIESQNHYHFFDNRVLPSHVDAERATAEKWWYKPDFIINDLNINSAVVYPQNGEVLKIQGANQSYTLKGYAYSGGGRKVIRCEISLDGGLTWRLSDITHDEIPNSFGKYWCWCRWQLEMPTADLVACKEIRLRAWDEGMNTQPRDITWNVMGMMNNCHFTIRVHVETQDGALALRFEHPTVAGPAYDETTGWMKKQVDEEEERAAAEKAAAEAKAAQERKQREGGVKLFAMSEVSKHDNEESAWIVHEGKVYDCTEYLKDHPGGAESILLTAGEDATEEFNAIHSTKARGMLDQYYIGDLAGAEEEGKEAEVKAADLAPASAEQAAPVALNPKKRIPFKLVEREELSHDTRRFRFALQSANHVLGLPVGNHMFFSAKVDGKLCMRAYTPVSSDEEVGYFDMVIKVYFAGVHPKFPEGGKLSQHFESMKIGDEIDVKGPLGHVSYQGQGDFTIHGKPRHYNHVGLIAGGTGITPCYQIIKAVLRNPEDQTKLSLLFANQTEEDILLRDELDRMAAEHPDRLRVHYTLDRPPQDWAFSKGFIDEAMLRQHEPKPASDAVVLMCGPPPMLKYACEPNLKKIGFEDEQVIAF